MSVGVWAVLIVLAILVKMAVGAFAGFLFALLVPDDVLPLGGWSSPRGITMIAGPIAGALSALAWALYRLANGSANYT